MKSLSAGLGTARTPTYARTLLGFVVAVAAFGAGNFAHAQPGQESSPTSTSRAADGGYRVVEFGRPLPRAPLPAGVESEPAAAPQILAVSFSAVAGPVRWYPPRRLIDVTVKFDRAVTVNTAGGTPRIDLVLGTRLLRHAGYASGSGSPELIFQYVTGDWNQALSDIAVGASSLRLNGGRIDSLADAIAADLAHAAGRLDNVGARPDFAADNRFLVAASGTGAGANYVALPPAVLRTPLPSLNPDDGVARSRRGRGLVGGQWTVPPVSGDPGAALASVTVRAQLRGLEPLLDLSLFQQAISGSPWTAPATAAIAFAPGESPRDTESALADVRQYRVTPAQDDETTATSNSLRAASTGVPEAPHLWAWVEGQTQVRLQWSRGSAASPAVEDHRIEVCAEADVLHCDDDDNDDDDWTVLVEVHRQAPEPRSNSYTHGGLVARSTRHYRVSSRNSLGHGAASLIKSATTQFMPRSADCTGARWSAYMTVAEWGLHDDKGYRAHGEAGGGDDEGVLTNYSFALGQITYEVNQLWYSPSVFSPTQRRGWIYFPPSYHLALSKFPDEGKLEDLTLYIGGIALPLSGAGYSTQTFGESFRWSTAQISDLERDERPTSMYEGTFSYRVGDTVEVCLTDSAPTVSLILTPSSISEDGDASTVTAMVEQGSESPFEVTVLVAADSPAATADFTLSENMVLSFAANEMQSTGIVTITGEDNDVHAPDKRLTVSGELSVGARPTPPGPVKLTIENDDAAPVLSVTVSEAAIVEAGGVSEVVVSTGDTTFAAVQTITLTFTGSAEKGTDYRVSVEQLTLPASEHSVTATVTAEQDTVDEDDETILISATHGGADVGTQQQITITDDEDEPELSITSDTVEEGESAEFEVTLDPASGRDVMVSYITEDVTATAGADYTALPSTTLTFAAGETARTLTVATADDTLHEQAETFLVTLSSATNATLEGGGNTLAGTGTINDNDVLPEVSIADATAVVEGAPAEFEVSLDVTSGSEVTVTYATGDADDTAQSPEDYTAVASTTLTFAVGVQVKTITVATEDDALDEANGETFTVTLSNPGNATLGSDTAATGTITDDDDPPELTIAGDTVSEGEEAEFVVSLNAASGQQVTVEYATADGTAKAGEDYTAATTGALTFTAGATERTISITTAEDSRNEDEEAFTVTLSNPGNATLGSDTAATGTITDDDDPPELTIAGDTVSEGEEAEFVVSLSPASGKQVTVGYATADGTAKAGEDYTAATTGALTFTAGATERTISITTAEDSRNEDEEAFTVTLSNPGNATLGSDTAATGTITDDDGTPELTIAGDTVSEGEEAEFVVSLSPASGKQVTVGYATADGTAKAGEDYTAATTGALTFTAGATERTISITTAEDSRNEDEEAFTVTLSNPGNATLGSDTAATGTITDDDDPPELTIAGDTVSEGEEAEFVVSLSPASGKQVTVGYATADGTAKAGEDYTAATTGALTFTAGATERTISITTAEDSRNEDEEAFTVTLSNPGNATLGSDTAATGTITDDDDPPELTIAGDTVSEGEEAEFVVSLNAASGKQVTVGYATADGTAKAGEDYTAATTGALTFTAGATERTISITTAEDSRNEDEEAFTVTLSNPGNATLGSDTAATGTITDDDGTPELTIAGDTVSEGEEAEFVVSLNAASGQQVTVEYATADGTAKAGEDYTAATTGALTFTAGATERTISITTAEDSRNEDEEAFTVTLSNPGNATLGSDTAATGTITDDDGTPELTIAGDTVSEGEEAEFVVSLNAASGQQVTVEYATADGTAKAGEDYTAATTGALTFTAGATERTISITTAEDSRNEDEEAFTVTLSNPGNATLGSDTAATGTITDDDDPPELTIAGDTVSEGEEAEFVVSLSPASGKQVTVGYATADGTAKAGEDYTAATTGALTFTAGATERTISITTAEDSRNEDEEAFTVTLSNPGNATLGSDTAATGTITDDDGTPELTIAGDTVSEGEEAEFVVSLNAASGQQVTVEYATADGTAKAGEDYTAATTGALTFTAGATERTISITTAEDSRNEDEEAFTVTLSNPGNATLGSDTAATGTITDDDDPPELTIAGDTVSEGEEAEFVVSLSPASGKQVTVGYATADGTAKAGEDYTAATTGALTFTAGATERTISITTAEDSRNEDEEAFTVTLSNPGNATLGSDTAATGTITDDDDPPELTIAGDTVSEGEEAEFVVSLNAASGQQVTVEYATADGTAKAGEDYTAATTGALTFTAGATERTISITTAEDSRNEDEEAFTVTLSNPGNATLGSDTAATGTITDDDDPPELTIAGDTMSEGEEAEFVVSLSPASGKQVTVGYATADGTAKAGEDYTAATTGALTFTAGATERTISITTAEDSRNEDEEAFTVTLSNPGNATLGSDTAATGTITDDDGTPELTIAGDTVSEGEEAEFVVSLNAASGQQVTVEYATADGTAKAGEDYTAATTGALTFTAGATERTISITTAEDSRNEDEEAFTVTLSNPGNATLGSDAAATGTITDDDGTPELTIAGDTVSEGEEAEFVVSLSPASGKQVTVGYATADGTAKAGEDYTAATTGALTFTAGATERTISITTAEDSRNEDEEAFTVTLSNPGNATLGSDAAATGTITDDDDPPELTIAGDTVSEGEEAEFVVSLSPASGKQVTVGYTTADGTAKAGEDYTAATTGALTFTAGATERTISITTAEDSRNEDEEAFTVTLSNPGNATLGSDTAATGTITDDDDPPELTIAGDTMSEGDEAEFVVSLSPASGKQVTVGYATADGTAKAGEDYTAATTGALTFTAGATERTISITTAEDSRNEDEEAFTVTLSNPGNATLGSDAAATGTITDDDDPPVLTIAGDTMSEGDEAEFVVSLSPASGKQVTVSYGTSDDTAAQPDDYTDTRGSLTFAAGDRTKAITVATSTDSLNETDETFTVTLSSPGNATLDADAGAANGIIEDDNELTVAVARDAPTVDEGKSATFTVTLTGGTSTEEVVVDYSLVGSATAGDDYTAPSGMLTIGADDTSGQITIETKEDSVLDRNETLEVRLDSGDSAGSVEVSTTTAETRIIDSSEVKVTVQPAVLVADDPETEPDESQDSSVVEEGTKATFTVKLSGAVGVEVLVPFETVDGSALAGADKDYTANSDTLTFAPSDTSKTVEIATRNDDLNEETETFELRLTAMGLPGGVTVTTASATGTITDNDTLTAAVTAVAPTVTEDQSATFTVTLTEGKKSTAEVVVDYSLVGSATEGDDYTAPSGTLTIGASDASGQIAIKTLQDNVLDRGETLELRLDSATTDGDATVNTTTAKTTITDPGTVQVSVTGLEVAEGEPPETVDKSSVEEGDPASFVVELSGAVQKTVEVSYATSDGTGSAATAGTDYTAADVTLTFASKETSKTVAVTTIVDTENEANETFTVTLKGVTLPEGVSLDASATTATGTIENDDALTAKVTANAETVPEGNAAEFTVELTGGTSTADVIVSYNTSDSTGTAGTDYTEPSGLLTITKPDSSGTIAIATLTDDILDPGETLSVRLTAVTTAIGTATIGTSATATTTIVQEGTVTVSVRKDEVLDDGVNEYEDKSTVEEGGSASFVVELSGAVAETVIAAYETTNGTGAGDAVADTDYTDTSGTLTFTSGESLTQTIAVKTTDDKLNEATEEFTVTLTGPDLPDLVSIGTSSAQGTITDNDGLTAAVTAAKPSVNEGESAEFVVALTGGTSNADVLSTAAVLVSYTVGGTATSGDDYTAPAALTLTIGSGDTSGTISVETLTDTVVAEGSETLEVTLVGATTATGSAAVDADNATATTAINDTTKATVTLRPPSGSRTSTASRSAARVAERSARTISADHCYPCPVEGTEIMVQPVLLIEGTTDEASMDLGTTATMTFSTSDGTAKLAEGDYEAAMGSITLTGNGPDKPITVGLINLVTLPDEQNETDEIFTLTTGSVDIGDNIIGEVPHTITIEDDDTITATIRPSKDVSVIEGESVSFTVTLSGGESTEDVRIQYSVGGMATMGDDYSAPSGTLTIAQDLRRGTFTIRTHDDTVVESDETLVVQLTKGKSAGNVRANDSATVTIMDNDSVTVSVEPATATEGDPASFVVRMSGEAPGAVEVSYETTNGTGAGAAVAGTDYMTASGTLTFSPGETSKTVEVKTLPDDLNEADETFTVTLTAPNLPTWATLGTDSATGTIEDDDGLTAAITADAEIVAEGDPATFTVALMPEDMHSPGVVSTSAVMVTYTVAGTASPNDDYTMPDLTLTIGAGETSGTIIIATHPDEELEPDETLLVTLQSASSVGEVDVDPTPAMTTIIDPPAVTIGDASAAESAGSVVFEVTLSDSSPRQVTVSYETEDGTAKAGEDDDGDYTKATGTLTFAEMVTVATISIALTDDTLDEDDETFAVRLSDPKYGRLGDTGITATGTIIDDDDPPAISVHDASAKERAGEIAFRVSLDAPSGRPVAVKYRTEEGTAKPGEDYGDTDGTVTLEAGQTAATIRVRLLNDTLEEPDETFTVRLMELENELTHAELADSTATGTIIDDDVSVAQVWLARFGRTVATHVVDAVGERLNESAGRSSEAAIAGHPLQPAPVPAEWQESTPIPYRTLVGHELVAGSSFRLASSGDEDEAAGGGSKWTGWGRGAVTRLAGKEPKADLSLRGTIATGTAGVDYDWGGVLTGLAMAYTGGGGNFQTDEPYLEPRSGMAESWLLSAHPYARVSVVDGLEVWGLLGYGLGMMTLTEDASVRTDITLMMGAAGVRGMLLTPVANGGFGVAVSSDGFAMRANADAAGHQPAVEADAVRGRLLLEGSYDAQLGDGSVLIPMVEAGMRYDAGHAEEGFGAELGGGFRYIKPEWGLTATANGRFVLAHQDLGFQEWGLRGSLQWSPGAGGLGPSLGVNTSVGTASSGVQRLWAQGATPIPATPESAGPAGRLDAQLGYGMSVDLFGTDALLMPYAGLTLADGGTQAYRVGGRANLGSSFSLSLQGERRERSGAAPAHGITLSGSLHW